MSLSVNQTSNSNLTPYCQANQPQRFVVSQMPADCCDFSSKQNQNQTFMNKVVSFAGEIKKKLSFEQIMKVITPQKPVNTLVKDEFSSQVKPPEPKYFEEGQKGYIPSTKGYVEKEEKQSYIPATTPAPRTEQDLTKVKNAIRNSYYAENFANNRMKSGINPHLGR